MAGCRDGITRVESSPASGEFIRGKLRLGVIGRSGEAGESPIQIGPRIDTPELAGGEDRIDHGRPVAGVGMSDEKPIFQTKLSRAEFVVRLDYYR